MTEESYRYTVVKNAIVKIDRLISLEMPRKKTPRKFKRGTYWPIKRSNDEIIEIEDGDSCTYGEACNRLRKSWKKLKIAKSTGDEISLDEAKEKINLLQVALGLETTDFEAYEEGVTDTWNEDEE